ncbi:juvenile hormone-binding protein-like [Galleria mellonella]|uniref:Juvenile hormone-binding protein-like n=1 Tax=Galleria mellonella TaxID=7137 RepID=A0A6J1W7P3_GALME|nr:juvenile hormone-binding protein-like [Galleria mellonella]
MKILVIFLILLISQIVVSDIVKTDHCSLTDAKCLTKALQKFLEESSQGTPDLTMKPTDPFTIQKLQFTLDKYQTELSYEDLIVTGFKYQKISKFNLDVNTHDIELNTTVDFTTTGTAKINFIKSGTTYIDTLKIQANAVARATYNYTPIINSKNEIQGYTIGPETIYCQLINKPKLKYTPVIEQTSLNKEKEEVYTTIEDDIGCNIVKTVFSTVIGNIRATALQYEEYNKENNNTY